MIYGKGFSLLKEKFIKEWDLYTNHKFIQIVLYVQLGHNELKKDAM